jgi:pilus assembly protein CpaC
MNGLTRTLLWGTLLALTMSGLASYTQAQPAKQEQVLVPLNGTYVIQMTTKKPIKKATAAREGVINIRPIQGDPTKVMLIGQAADTTKLELIDEDNKTETYEVVVQRDVENLKVQLRRAVPTGNILVTPISDGAVLLTGTLSRAADTTVVDQVVAALGFRAINQLNVGGVQQVQLDVVVAIVSRSEFRRMAFDFLVNSSNFYFSSTGSGAAVTPATAGTGGAISTAALGLVGGTGSPNGAPTNLLFGVLHNSYNLLGFLQALRDENILKLQAEPRLVTLSGRPASFLSGGEQAVPVPAGLGQVGVQFEEFGTRLNFIPIVLGNGRIHLEVEPEVSTLDPAAGTTIQGTTVPGRSTHRINTTVEMDVGHTFVIGGLIQHEVIGSTSKVPVLGDLPFVGTLFSRKAYQETENEVLVLVTPHLVEAVDCSQVPKLLPGQETRSPDDFELFLEGILEAPRGQRCVWENHHYVPAFKHSPTMDMFPCGPECEGCLNGHGRDGCGGGCANGGCASGNCANGSCGASGSRVMPQPQPQQQPQALPSAAPQAQPVAPTSFNDTGAMIPPLPSPMPMPSGEQQP